MTGFLLEVLALPVLETIRILWLVAFPHITLTSAAIFRAPLTSLVITLHSSRLSRISTLVQGSYFNTTAKYLLSGKAVGFTNFED
jgi:hypothetical protein